MYRRRAVRASSRSLVVEPLEDRTVPTTLPGGFTESPFATGLNRPAAMEFAPDGRLFVAEQTGALRVIKNGSLLPTPFVSLTVDSSGERGLLGVTFDPAFATNHFVYVYYTVPGASAHNRVSRFTAAGDVAAAGSEDLLLDLDPLSTATNHNGGGLHFGTDGKLYISVGENGNGANAQTLANLLGKVLRINPDGSIPTDNPFFATASGKDRAIWALGLRNPFTFAVQPDTGLFYINDVGENVWEEIDQGGAGRNYGWPVHEGVANDPSYTDPIFAYSHNGQNAAITGGTFYQAGAFPAFYQGKYFFADFIKGFIRVLDPATHQVGPFADGAASPVDLDVGPDGSLYYLSIFNGTVYQIQSSAPAFRTYVTHLYRDVLQRDPDSAGLNTWIQQLSAGTPRLQVAHAFWASAEHRGLQVDGYYQTYLHRVADANGRSALVNQMVNGLSETSAILAFLTSAEYQRLHPDNSAYVDALYTDVLGRAADTQGKTAFVQKLQNGTSRATVAGEFLGSAERFGRVVDSYYTGFLKRTESSAERQGWVQQLLDGRQTTQSLAELFLSSAEYFNRP